MADVVKALALDVCIAPVGVRVPGVAATKMDIGKAPCTEGALVIQKQDVSGRPADKKLNHACIKICIAAVFEAKVLFCAPLGCTHICALILEMCARDFPCALL